MSDEMLVHGIWFGLPIRLRYGSDGIPAPEGLAAPLFCWVFEHIGNESAIAIIVYDPECCSYWRALWRWLRGTGTPPEELDNE